MAKKISNNPISSYLIDWTNDTTNHNWPFSGASIQAYLRGGMELLETLLTTEEITNLLNLN